MVIAQLIVRTTAKADVVRPVKIVAITTALLSA